MSIHLPSLPTGGLILTRRAGEEIIIEIDGRVVAAVELLDTAGRGRARLRVRAAPDVVVNRREVYERAATAS